MRIVHHPKLAEDIREVSTYYGEVSERVLAAFWKELDEVLGSIEKNPERHHFDACGLRRANFRRFPYHLLYEVVEESVYLVVLRHNKRRPDYGIGREM